MTTIHIERSYELDDSGQMKLWAKGHHTWGDFMAAVTDLLKEEKRIDVPSWVVDQAPVRNIYQRSVPCRGSVVADRQFVYQDGPSRGATAVTVMDLWLPIHGPAPSRPAPPVVIAPAYKNAIIKSVKLDRSDRGFLTAWIDLDYGHSGQGFGGYALYLPPSFSHHKIESLAGHFIFRIMEVAGADEWARVPGKTVRVIGSHSGVEALGHIVNDDWFNPRKDFEFAGAWKDEK